MLVTRIITVTIPIFSFFDTLWNIVEGTLNTFALLTHVIKSNGFSSTTRGKLLSFAKETVLFFLPAVRSLATTLYGAVGAGLLFPEGFLPIMMDCRFNRMRTTLFTMHATEDTEVANALAKEAFFKAPPSWKNKVELETAFHFTDRVCNKLRDGEEDSAALAIANQRWETLPATTLNATESAIAITKIWTFAELAQQAPTDELLQLVTFMKSRLTLDPKTIQESWSQQFYTHNTKTLDGINNALTCCEKFSSLFDNISFLDEAYTFLSHNVKKAEQDDHVNMESMRQELWKRLGANHLLLLLNKLKEECSAEKVDVRLAKQALEEAKQAPSGFAVPEQAVQEMIDALLVIGTHYLKWGEQEAILPLFLEMQSLIRQKMGYSPATTHRLVINAFEGHIASKRRHDYHDITNILLLSNTAVQFMGRGTILEWAISSLLKKIEIEADEHFCPRSIDLIAETLVRERQHDERTVKEVVAFLLKLAHKHREKNGKDTLRLCVSIINVLRGRVSREERTEFGMLAFGQRFECLVQRKKLQPGDIQAMFSHIEEVINDQLCTGSNHLVPQLVSAIKRNVFQATNIEPKNVIDVWLETSKVLGKFTTGYQELGVDVRRRVENTTKELLAQQNRKGAFKASIYFKAWVPSVEKFDYRSKAKLIDFLLSEACCSSSLSLAELNRITLLLGAKILQSRSKHEQYMRHWVSITLLDQAPFLLGKQDERSSILIFLRAIQTVFPQGQKDSLKFRSATLVMINSLVQHEIALSYEEAQEVVSIFDTVLIKREENDNTISCQEDFRTLNGKRIYYPEQAEEILSLLSQNTPENPDARTTLTIAQTKYNRFATKLPSTTLFLPQIPATASGLSRQELGVDFF
ncbi:hypothetical protein JYU14_01595 [Simkania negevensis]|uniref:Uncharacterized protein n=1 Tax=Simkania negevensis TaxID=83561 RepID=A0ABS3APY2_9BACT|nr:hypothetical protein [Simkania negevensis]